MEELNYKIEDVIYEINKVIEVLTLLKKDIDELKEKVD